MKRHKGKLALTRETLLNLADLSERQARAAAGGVLCSKCDTTCATCVNCATIKCGATARCTVGPCASNA